jgi:hypothetical protein
MAARKVNSRKKRQSLRDSLFHDMSGVVFPQPGEEGWAMLPRYMPSIFQLISDTHLSKGMDLTRPLVGLWCDNYGEGVIEIADESQYAAMAGFRGERGLRSWRDRVLRLDELGFIKVHAGTVQKIGHVLIIHPLEAVRRLYERGQIPEGWWGDFHARVVGLGLDPARLVPRKTDISVIAPDGQQIVIEAKVNGGALGERAFAKFLSTFSQDLGVKGWRLADDSLAFLKSHDKEQASGANLPRHVTEEPATEPPPLPAHVSADPSPEAPRKIPFDEALSRAIREGTKNDDFDP